MATVVVGGQQQQQPGMPMQQMQQPTVVVVNNNSGPPPRDLACCCCLPMNMGIYGIAVIVLINIYGLWGGISVGRLLMMISQTYGLIFIIVIVVAYLPQIAFFFFIVKGMQAGDHTSDGRMAFRNALKFLLISYLLNMLGFPLLGLIFAGGVGFFFALPFLIQFAIDTCLVAWWRSNYTEWWVQKVMEENNNQWPAGLKR